MVFVVALLWNLTYAGVARWRWQQGLLGPCPNPRTYIYIYIYIIKYLEMVMDHDGSIVQMSVNRHGCHGHLLARKDKM